MKRILIAPFLCLIITLLCGCGPVYETHYHYYAPQAWQGRKCVNKCLAARSSCRMECATLNQSCRNSADLAALPGYITYNHEADKSGEPNDTSLNDFADTSGCNASCGCNETFRECFENCGGTIKTTTVCTAFCPTTPQAPQNNLIPTKLIQG